METEAQDPGKWWRDFFLFSSISLPQPFLVLGAALRAEDQVLRRMDWSSALQNPLSRISKSRSGVGGRVRVPWGRSSVRQVGLEEVMLNQGETWFRVVLTGRGG